MVDNGIWLLTCLLYVQAISSSRSRVTLTHTCQTYGVVPQSVYPESFSSSSSRPLDKLVTLKLREHALILRDLSSTLRATSSLSAEAITSLLRKKKEELLGEVWNIMSVTLGKPPGPDDTFVWDYEDGHGKVKRWEGTPKDFYKSFSSQSYPVGRLPPVVKLSLKIGAAHGILFAHQ